MPRGRRNGHRWRELCNQVKREEDYCCLCGGLVDKDLPGTHPAGPSVHHLEELNRGGSLFDRDNVGLAHLGCNSAHGDGRPRARQRRGLRYEAPPSVTQRRW